MNNYLLVVDTYEAKTIDESVLKANNISGMVIRMNHMAGGHHLDTKFTTQWEEAGKAGLLRVPYFVYNPWVDGQVNYEWFVKHMPYEAGAIMIDVEVVFPGYSPITYAAELAKFCSLVAPRWSFMIYTGEGYLNLLSSWPQNVDYWWAQYPASLYPEPPQKWTWEQVRAQVNLLNGPNNANKVPGRLKMWQISDHLIVPGCNEPLDVNVYPGTFDELKAWINEKPPKKHACIEEHTQPYDGVEFHTVYRFNSCCFITVINPTGKRFLVTKFGRKKVSTVARELGADLVINGGGYTASQAVGLHASEGRVYQPVKDYEPWVNLTADNKPQINAYNSSEKKYNALAGKRFIVMNGKVSPNTSVSWREVHPRTLVGVTQDGKLIECVIDGRQGPENIGVNLYDAAKIMIEFGAVKAIDLDGGGSSTMWLKDKVVNSPIEDGKPGNERFVATHLVMFASNTPPPDHNYMVIAPVKPRLTPSMYQVIAKANLPVGTSFHGEITKDVTETIPPLVGTTYNMTWVQMPDGYWVPKSYKIEYVKKIKD